MNENNCTECPRYNLKLKDKAEIINDLKLISDMIANGTITSVIIGYETYENGARHFGVTGTGSENAHTQSGMLMDLAMQRLQYGWRNER